jgi:hypothetical protein
MNDGKLRAQPIIERKIMKTRFIKTVTTFAACIALQGTCKAGQFHWPLGVSFTQGIFDAVDKLDDLYTAAGYDFDRQYIVPLGLTFSPYYEFDNGLGIGLNLGPTAFIAIDNHNHGYHYHSDDTDVSYIIPIGADLRYTFLRDQDISPYARVGIRYPIVGGHNLDSSDPGAFGALGVEFWRTRKVGLGAEVGYDTSRIRVKGPDGDTKGVTYAGFTFSVFVLF